MDRRRNALGDPAVEVAPLHRVVQVPGSFSSDGGFVPDVLWASLVAAAGMWLAYVPALNAGLSAVGPDQSGLASGLLGTSYQSARRPGSP